MADQSYFVPTTFKFPCQEGLLIITRHDIFAFYINFLQVGFSSLNYCKNDSNNLQVSILPDKCPRKVNRDIIDTMVQAYGRIFGTRRPVFDGRSNMYTRDPLPIGHDAVELEVTLPGEGRDRVFLVTIKFADQVSFSIFKSLFFIFYAILLFP